MNSMKLALIAVLAALSIGTNYAMISFYNVKFMDFIVFVAGFCFGPVVGALIGITSWTVYGVLNPLGFSLHIWLATMFSEPIYGVAGAFLRKSLDINELNLMKKERVNFCIFLGTLGMLLTFVYDIVTNIVWGYVYNLNIFLAVIMGFFPFGLVHMVSNAFFFGIGGIPAINAVLSVIGGENSGVPKK